mmetsp:Transcript_36730/g.55438  ORF Transcript_36730/g.55438 Transcript_36730/m.55438 type:complete len:121 (-) Transcript_36730:159-521(-)
MSILPVSSGSSHNLTVSHSRVQATADDDEVAALRSALEKDDGEDAGVGDEGPLPPPPPPPSPNNSTTNTELGDATGMTVAFEIFPAWAWVAAAADCTCSRSAAEGEGRSSCNLGWQLMLG